MVTAETTRKNIGSSISPWYYATSNTAISPTCTVVVYKSGFHLGGGEALGYPPLEYWEQLLLIRGQNGPKLQSQRS